MPFKISGNNSLKAVNRFTDAVNPKKKQLIELNFGAESRALAPHGPIPEIDKSHPKKGLAYVNRYAARVERPYKKITSLSMIARIIKRHRNNPEGLAQYTFTQQGQQFLFHKIIVDQNEATEIALKNKYPNIDFIVYGVVRSVVKREKIMYINFDTQDGMKPFNLFVFAGDYKLFTLSRPPPAKPFSASVATVPFW